MYIYCDKKKVMMVVVTGGRANVKTKNLTMNDARMPHQ